MSISSPNVETSIKEQKITKNKINKPTKWQVVLHNDDVTPMDFVIAILMKVFSHSEENATKIMWDIHNNGKGIAGVYTKEIASTKKSEVDSYNQAYKLNLKSTIEPVSN
jgi:ATP-dependent Clp protease adaptor protein ClpS